MALAVMVAVFAMVSFLSLREDVEPPRARSEWVPLTDFADSATSPALSSDGRMLTFLRGPGTFMTPGQVYVKMLPDGAPVRLTDDNRTKMSPAFSPDGSVIAYGAPMDIWVVPVLGGTPRLLLPNASGLSWIDERRILYSEIDTGLHMRIVTSTESRTGSRNVYPPAEANGMAHRSYLSPDGNWILVAEMDEVGWLPCRLVPMDGSSPGHPVGLPRRPCQSAAWSPSGEWMYINTHDGGDFDIWRQRFPDGEPEQVTSATTEEMGIAMAPDGRSLITSVGGEQSTLWIHDGDGERQVTSEGFAMFPRLSPDGKTLYYLKQGVAGLPAREAVGCGSGVGQQGAFAAGVHHHPLPYLERRQEDCFRRRGLRGYAAPLVGAARSSSPAARDSNLRAFHGGVRG